MRRPAVMLTALGLTVVLALVLFTPTVAGWRGMGGHQGYQSGDPITVSQARERADAFLAEAGYATLVTADVIEFSNHFFAQVVDVVTGAGALELVVSRDGGIAHPAPGPGMMWNTEHSPMLTSSGQPLCDAMMQGMHQTKMGSEGMRSAMMDGMSSGAMNHQTHDHDGPTRGMPEMMHMDGMCPFAMTVPTGGATLDEPLDVTSVQSPE